MKDFILLLKEKLPPSYVFQFEIGKDHNVYITAKYFSPYSDRPIVQERISFKQIENSNIEYVYWVIERMLTKLNER